MNWRQNWNQMVKLNYMTDFKNLEDAYNSNDTEKLKEVVKHFLDKFKLEK